MTTEAELATKLREEVFSVEANPKPEEPEPETTEEEEPEPEPEPEEEEVVAEVEEPTEQEREERLAEEEERPDEEEPPAEEPEAEEEFYVAASDRIRYKTREETERALREQVATIGRQSQEVGQLRHEREQQAELINQLREQVSENQQDRLFVPSFPVSAVETALESLEENPLGPAAHVIAALKDEGDVALAYAICDAWEEHDPVNARHARRGVDSVYAATQNYQEPEQEPEPLTEQTLGDALAYLARSVPDFADYQEAMQQVSSELSDDHWIARDLETGDETARLRALYTVYELAKGRSVGVAAARDQIKNDKKQKAASARRKAAVASGQTSAGGSDTPRTNTARFLDNMRTDWRKQGLFVSEQ